MLKIIILLNFFIFNSIGVAALSPCMQLSIKEKAILKTSETLSELEKLQSTRAQAQKIQRLIIDGFDPASVLNTSEQQALELAILEEEQRTNTIIAAPTIGGLMLFGIVVTTLKKTVRGRAYLAKLANIKLYKKYPKLFKSAILTGLAFEVVSSIYFAVKIKQNNDKQNQIKEIIEMLNNLADQANKVHKFREDLESLVIEKEMILEEIEYDELICE